MSDADAFWAACRQFPDDPGPLRVYADWLDERGRADAAEWLRVRAWLLEFPEPLPVVVLERPPVKRVEELDVTDWTGEPWSIWGLRFWEAKGYSADPLPVGARVEAIIPGGASVRPFEVLSCFVELVCGRPVRCRIDLRSAGPLRCWPPGAARTFARPDEMRRQQARGYELAARLRPSPDERNDLP